MTEEEFKNLERTTEAIIKATQCPDCGEEMQYIEITDVYGNHHWVGTCSCQFEIEDDDDEY